MNVFQSSISLFGLLCVLIEQGETMDHFGLLEARDVDSGVKDSFCFMYNPMFKELPSAGEPAEELRLSDLSLSQLCDGVITTHVTDTVVAVARGNCTFAEKALAVQNAGGAVALIISQTALQQPVANSSAQYKAINISVALMRLSDFAVLKNLGRNLRLELYSYSLPRYDYNMIIIWVIAMTTIAVGGYWSGVVKHKQSLKKSQKKSSPAVDGTTVPEEAEEVEEAEEAEDTVDVTPCAAVVFVVIMCLMLLALYFFYQYLVYVIIGLFALASAMALYSCLKVITLRVPILGGCSIPKNRLLKNGLEIRLAILAVLCVGSAIWWIVERNKDYAWILQDILGVAFCINVLKTVRMKSLKTCAVILSLLFFYDIFFVFITPFIMPGGQSIMVDVATGAGSSSTESIPMVLKLPRLSRSAITKCLLPYSMLGFGDIVVPGMLISYCHSFDLKIDNGHLYFGCLLFAYGIGLVVTFLALIFTSLAQPALLYIVPCVLLTTCLIGWRRSEFCQLWTGDKVTKHVNKSDNVTSTQATCDTLTKATNDTMTQPSGDSSTQTNSDNSATVSPVPVHCNTLHEDVISHDRQQLLTRT